MSQEYQDSADYDDTRTKNEIRSMCGEIQWNEHQRSTASDLMMSDAEEQGVRWEF